VPTGPDPAVEAAKKREEMEKTVAANKSRRNKGLFVGGAGLAVLAAGGVFGVLAVLKNNDVHCAKPCIAGSPAATTADNTTDGALLFANVANVAIPLGAIVTIVGAYLVLTTGPTVMPPEPTKPTDTRANEELTKPNHMLSRSGEAGRELPAAPPKSTLLSRGFVMPSMGGLTLGSSW
jgi:hypothetical protein